MPEMRTRTTLAALVLALGAASPSASAQDAKPAVPQVAVTRIRGETTKAERLVDVDKGALVLERSGTAVSVPLDDTIEVAFATQPDPPREFAPDEVEVRLWSGERFFGRIVGSDGVTLDTPLLGRVEVELDHLEGLYFRKRLDEVVEPPDFGASPGGDHPDAIHMVGGDRIRCTLESLGAEELKCATAANDVVRVRYERMTALRLGLLAAPKPPPKGVLLDVILRDGSRVTGTDPAVDGTRLRVKSVSGFEAWTQLRNVVAIHVRSDAFRYLSDVDAPEVAVKPFWKPVAGDANRLYAPRMDRAWSGKPLRCGGRSWLKGVGVFSGTTLTWKLDGTFAEFRTSAGVDDGAGRLGGVVFEVWVDDQRAWTSGFVRGANAPGRGAKGVQSAGRIPLAGAKTLSLKVLPGDGEDPYPIQDHADWLGAMLVKAPGTK